MQRSISSYRRFLANMPPSSAKELAHFERIRDQFDQQDRHQLDATTTPPNSQAETSATPFSTPLSLPVRSAGNPHLSGLRALNHNNTSLASKGKGKGNIIANPDSGPDSNNDEYTVHTRHLTNGSISSGAKGKGKGKGEASANANATGFVDDDDDEDIYS